MSSTKLEITNKPYLRFTVEDKEHYCHYYILEHWNKKPPYSHAIYLLHYVDEDDQLILTQWFDTPESLTQRLGSWVINALSITQKEIKQ